MADESKGDAAAARKGVSVQLRFLGHDDKPLVFADHTIIGGMEDDIVLTFYQFDRPIAPVADGDVLPARCVGRIIMPPSRAQQLLAALEEQFTKRTEK